MNEALEEISQKINLLNEEQDRIDGQSEYDYHSIRTCIDCFGCTADAGLYFYRETFDDYWISGDRNSDYSFLFVFDI